jgi:radical SAM protein with 4Fe4S-binding SPASM domain
MTYNYSNKDLKTPIDLSQQEEFLLKESKRFCMYPWIHIHAYPTGEVFPCCQSEMKDGPIGNAKNNTLAEIWNSPKQRKIRLDMLSETPNSACSRCYEQESAGFVSGRQSANKHHGHHINKIHSTTDSGELADMQLSYWDIRFSNLCNLRCRSCGHIFSSQWHQDQKKVTLKSYWNNVKGEDWPVDPPSTMEEFHALPENVRSELTNDFGSEIIQHLKYVKSLPVLFYAGRTETDMWEQLEPHLDYVEQIYFAGGEPLLMEEHYNILDELARREMYHVRLTYNTNFTHTDLKERSVFDYWKKFKNMSVGASLDAMGPRAEYIRKGTNWKQIEKNRQQMLEICPDVDFYISPTVSILNALHIPDFHRNWVERGLIRAQDLNVNILQDPVHYRIDIAPPAYKQQLTEVYQDHIKWLKTQGDPLGRAIHGFESAITFMNATDNTHLIDTFWRKTNELDSIRKEQCLDVLPELKALK